ncbi:MAG TPA: HRDC domain-containing protein [Solirubrobacteraceae bacterium]|jgi:ribonuclease D
MSRGSGEVSSSQQADPALSELEALARQSGSLAVDTEFMGEGRYRTLLCLVQLAVRDEAGTLHTALIDPLSDELDAGPLISLLSDPEIEVIMHAGRQDTALLRRRFDTEVTAIFDTQVAAGFAGFAAQASYHTLLREVLTIDLTKTASFTRWDARPLSKEQLRYAREDALHLPELATELKRRLHTAKRLEWALQECQAVQCASDARDLESVFLRLPRVRNLSAAAQAVARELVEWREQVAAAGDRPVQGVLADAVLVEVAKRKPASIHQLQGIRGMGPGTLRRDGQGLLDAIRRGADRPHEPLAQLPRTTRSDTRDAALIALCEALVRARTIEAGLAYELVASRSDLQAIVAAKRVNHAEPDVRTLRGWRRELVGEELLELLDGRVSLSSQNASLRVATARQQSRTGRLLRGRHQA